MRERAERQALAAHLDAAAREDPRARLARALGYHLLPAVRADLLIKLGRPAEARSGARARRLADAERARARVAARAGRGTAGLAIRRYRVAGIRSNGTLLMAYERQSEWSKCHHSLGLTVNPSPPWRGAAARDATAGATCRRDSRRTRGRCSRRSVLGISTGCPVASSYSVRSTAAAAVVPRALRRVGDEPAPVERRRVPEHLRHVPRAVGIVDEQAVAERPERACARTSASAAGRCMNARASS